MSGSGEKVVQKWYKTKKAAKRPFSKLLNLLVPAGGLEPPT